MSEIVGILFAGVGLPVLGLTIIFTTMILRTWWVKSKELKIKEEQMRLEAKIRQDQTNQQIIDSHSHNISTREMEGIYNEIRELRDELARVKADTAAMSGHSSTEQTQIQQNVESARQMQDRNI